MAGAWRNKNLPCDKGVVMAADIQAAFSLAQRAVAIQVLQTDAEVPAFYRHKIQAYLDARKAKREETTHADC
jgi:hypothetical protein